MTNNKQKYSLSTEYDINLNHFNNNKNLLWNEWLEFHSTFKKPGKQGLTGIMTYKSDKNCKYVFKLSQYINYLVEHEYTVMNGLTNISSYCPHFCKCYGIIECNVDPDKRKSGNPFHTKDKKHQIDKTVLLMEYIEDSYKFCNYIKSEDINDSIIYSTIKQVLMAISIAQRKKEFTHYDLHSDNIMLKQCDKDLVILYILDEDNQFLVPTFGYYPVIIDYGFSYIKDMDNNYLWPSLSHTDIGFTSDRYDSIADPKLFLISVSDELVNYRKNKKSKKFRNIVKNIFEPLSVQWDCGWDDIFENSASDYILELLDNNYGDSIIFKECENYCIDLLQSLIILPIENKSFDSLIISFKSFIEEFVKIEKQIGNNFYNLYILKGIIDSARDVRSDYYDKNTRNEALKKFRYACYDKIEKVAKFCKTKDIHFEKMLCSLFVLANSIEGVYYEIIETKLDKKYKEYNKLKLNTPEQIYGCIDVNMQDKYVYNKDTIILTINCVNEDFKALKLSEKDIDDLNNIHSLSRGSYLYENLKNVK